MSCQILPKKKIAIIWNSPSVPKHLNSVKEDEKINYTILPASWQPINTLTKFQNENFHDYEGILILVELNWTFEERSSLLGLDLIKKIRLEKKVLLPIVLVSFIPIKILLDLEEATVLKHEICEKNFIQLPYNFCKLSLKNNFNSQQTTVKNILATAFRNEYNDHEGDIHANFIQIIRVLTNWNHGMRYGDPKILEWSRIQPKIQLIKICYDFLANKPLEHNSNEVRNYLNHLIFCLKMMELIDKISVEDRTELIAIIDKIRPKFNN